MGGFRRFLVRMALFLVAAMSLVVFLAPDLADAFQANPALNGLIAAVLAIGIVHAFRQVLALRPEMRWLEVAGTPSRGPASLLPPPRLLAPIARMLDEKAGKRKAFLSALSVRSLLDTVSFRLDEARDISRYMIGLLIFLGLLGTFWGLLQTVDSVGTVIGSLSVNGEDLVQMFANLKSGLEKPLAGMGTAFSSSLFGLAGSLVLGFLDLQAGQAQNQFTTSLEEWLSNRARLTSSSSGDEVGDGPPVPVYVQALLEQTAEGIDELQKALSQSEQDRRSANETTNQVAEHLVKLTDQMRNEQQTTERLADALSKGNQGGLDEASRDHLRSIDVLLRRIAEDNVSGRENLVQGLRQEIKLLARTISAGEHANKKKS